MAPQPRMTIKSGLQAKVSLCSTTTAWVIPLSLIMSLPRVVTTTEWIMVNTTPSGPPPPPFPARLMQPSYF